MATDQPNEAVQFHQFLGEQIHQGTNLPPEDILDEWREMHPADDDDEFVADVKEALDGLAAGKPTTPAKEFFQNLRRELGLNDR
jgi:hypothetical protein